MHPIREGQLGSWWGPKGSTPSKMSQRRYGGKIQRANLAISIEHCKESTAWRVGVAQCRGQQHPALERHPRLARATPLESLVMHPIREGQLGPWWGPKGSTPSKMSQGQYDGKIQAGEPRYLDRALRRIDGSADVSHAFAQATASTPRHLWHEERYKESTAWRVGVAQCRGRATVDDEEASCIDIFVLESSSLPAQKDVETSTTVLYFGKDFFGSRSDIEISDGDVLLEDSAQCWARGEKRT
ncbi:hypothetical protein DFH09DRAFT_1113083 [Mycena vulgaris]|nr:hypothetical protein DFH09DRAFT_1113083 [Mycena vulgaris]